MWEYTEGGGFQSSEKSGASPTTGGDDGGPSNNPKRERLGSYQKIFRFGVKNGKVKNWYAARIEDGKVVWEDH